MLWPNNSFAYRTYKSLIGLERRRPRLHECEARKGTRDLRTATSDAAEATALQAGTPAFQSVPTPARFPIHRTYIGFEIIHDRSEPRAVATG
jgi:hypothetical protein